MVNIDELHQEIDRLDLLRKEKNKQVEEAMAIIENIFETYTSIHEDDAIAREFLTLLKEHEEISSKILSLYEKISFVDPGSEYSRFITQELDDFDKKLIELC